MTFATHGNPGCEIWFRRFADLSKTGRVWELNEEGRHLKVARNEEEYRQLARRFGRYKRAREDAIGEIGYEKTTGGAPDKFIGRKHVRKRVIEKREKEGYCSEGEDNRYTERKGSGGKKGQGKKGPKGKAHTPIGENRGDEL